MEITGPAKGFPYREGQGRFRAVAQVEGAALNYAPGWPQVTDVKGTADCFHECFIDDGQVDTFAVVQKLLALGFDGFMIPDHVPATVGDSGWHHRGRAHCVGFMQALIQVANKLQKAA